MGEGMASHPRPWLCGSLSLWMCVPSFPGISPGLAGAWLGRLQLGLPSLGLAGR